MAPFFGKARDMASSTGIEADSDDG
ncbi:unnamed protein product, partial [Diplocarpon coronariae]